jgi:hypothetical protein
VIHREPTDGDRSVFDDVLDPLFARCAASGHCAARDR